MCQGLYLIVALGSQVRSVQSKNTFSQEIFMLQIYYTKQRQGKLKLSYKIPVYIDEFTTTKVKVTESIINKLDNLKRQYMVNPNQRNLNMLQEYKRSLI
jgi:hypothetical protein